MNFQNPSMQGSQDVACIRFHSDFFKAHKLRKEITQTRRKMGVSYFSMRNPYMKF